MWNEFIVPAIEGVTIFSAVTALIILILTIGR